MSAKKEVMSRAINMCATLEKGYIGGKPERAPLAEVRTRGSQLFTKQGTT